MRALIFSTLDYLKGKAPHKALPIPYPAALATQQHFAHLAASRRAATQN